ncbi:hypothetical protein NBZ79_05575 [Sneathiella marina]|uniref:Quercetin 2,3-dioxygenase C-terminal cupin domain-containing protein n=1 Tax=Sneathiella marina TaxID=2950108 RepID=A0ABY4W5H8_9PROT|nr:hypothetical protein [Sneathiella marina]USG62445.1 hypothetical protein NBZ79_05575 [Sneathiella marina]
MPERTGQEPSYEQKAFSEEEKRGQLRLIGSRNGRDGSITIHQDVDLYATVLKEDDTVSHELAAGRKAWLHVVDGALKIGDETLNHGDGVAIEGPQTITLTGTLSAEVLLFDMD